MSERHPPFPWLLPAVQSAFRVPTDSSPWTISMAGVLTRHPRVPRGATRLLSRLDRYGSIRLTRSGLGFDDEDVDWSQVTSVERGDLVNLIAAGALEDEYDRLKNLLPRVPGRKWMVRAAMECMIGLSMAVIEQASTGRGFSRPVIASVRHQDGRRKEQLLRPGAFALLVQAVSPDIYEVLCRTAERAGVVLLDSEGTRMRPRTEAAFERVRKLMERLQDEAGED